MIIGFFCNWLAWFRIKNDIEIVKGKKKRKNMSGKTELQKVG